jgi:hypothetical protein
LSDTAYALSLSDQDTFPEVFATSRMVALMELAAARLVKPILKDGQLLAGVSVNVQHTAASPLGSQIRGLLPMSHLKTGCFVPEWRPSMMPVRKASLDGKQQ